MRILEYQGVVWANPNSSVSAELSIGSGERAELFRLLGDEDRLKLLALCAEEELTVGELAVLLGESQPQVTKKSQPLREVGLLSARRDGTRTLLRASPSADVVVMAAVEAGRGLCMATGSLARIAAIVAQREDVARRAFDAPAPSPVTMSTDDTRSAVLEFLPVLRALLPSTRLAVDVGTGEGTLLPLVAPLFDRVLAVDRSAARLARCAVRIEGLGLSNVRLVQCEVDDSTLQQDVQSRGGADVVFMVRVLRHVARPQDAVNAAARLLRGGGHLVVVDALPHDDERMRDQGDVWLGFPPAKLKGYFDQAALVTTHCEPLLSFGGTPSSLPLQCAVGRKPTAHEEALRT